MQPRNIFDGHIMKPIDDGENEPFQQDECNPIDNDDINDEFFQPLNQADMDDIMKDANATAYINLWQGSASYNNKDDDESLWDDNNKSDM